MTVHELQTALKNSQTLVAKASAFAERAHNGQERKSGEPYFIHCLETAKNLASWNLDEITIAAGLLHDVAEDTKYTLQDIENEFGKEIAFLVDGVTKLGRVKYRGKKEQADNLRKFILAMAEDLRVVFIKLADRLHNIKTLGALPPHKQKRIARETSEIYATLAYRLGMQKLSGELQDFSFPYVHPEEYKWLLKNVKDRYEEREKYLQKIAPLVKKTLFEGNINPLSIDFRAKRYASLYHKLLHYDMDIDKIYDLVAFRIVLKTVEDCYAALGIIHKLWTPLPGRIKDYIAMPKPNGYRSLHTTILCIDHKIVEFQIRTKEMHDEAENGIAAHWAYKKANKKNDNKKIVQQADSTEVMWIEQLRSWQKQFTDPEEFIDSLKIDFFRDRIFAITPDGEVIDLPKDATPVDFAYQIHSEIGDQCVGARVNGKIVPLDFILTSNDIVEIITQKNKKPSQSWLEFAVTASAKQHIRSALKKTHGKHASLLGERSKQVEFNIVAYDKIGVLKDISTIITRLHVNMVNVNSNLSPRQGTHFHVIRVTCDTNDKTKVWKIMLKLKALPAIKEINYRFV
ncbi:MAG: RelA/SpoT family protein [bacterium]